jgi:hypothetical protein
MARRTRKPAGSDESKGSGSEAIKRALKSSRIATPPTIEKMLWPRERVDSWLDFQGKIEPYLDGKWLFRGVGSVRHQLIPSVGRRRDGVAYSLRLEQDLFDQFKREALPLLSSRPATEWEWLALAQHHGVPTRLLDWSESPLVSLFFAVWGSDEEDAAIYIVPRPEVRTLKKDPFVQEFTCFYYPGYVTPRLVSQRGVFTVHPDPIETYTPEGIKQIVIARSLKADFRQKLDSTGVHHAAIFADLDGLSRRLTALQVFSAPPSEQPIPPSGSFGKINPLDPQKGRWGGKPESGDWQLSAQVGEISPDWYSVLLRVRAKPGTGKRLQNSVIFYLHDSFNKPVVEVQPVNNEAVHKTAAYGAFTVGARVTQDDTLLERDLAELKSAPKLFRER